jgi:peroxiredoxin
MQGVILAVPGAFTPGCSKTHLPGWQAVGALHSIMYFSACDNACPTLQTEKQQCWLCTAGYVRDYEKFKAAGADIIACVATNGRHLSLQHILS